MVDEYVLQQIDAVLDKDTDDLYKQLGMASLGTESIMESIASRNALIAVARNVHVESALFALENQLLQVKGKQYFHKIWEGLKDAICGIYKNGTKVDNEKDLVAYLVTILIAAGHIANPVLILVVTVAVKQGLDQMCEIPAVAGGN